MNDAVLTEDAAGVRVLTLNRPQARNAINRDLSGALLRAVVEAEGDDTVRVLVLTGADPAFCAGIDLKEAGRDGAKFFQDLRRAAPMDRVARMAKPVIGAINGPAFTGGLELALACDFLVASERAVFADTHAPVGVMPRSGLTVRLPQRVGQAQALRMSLTSEQIDAERAAQIGLVTEVVAHDQLRARAIQLAERIAESPASTIRSIRRMYTRGAETMLGPVRDVAEGVARAYTADYDDLEGRRDAVLRRNRASRPGGPSAAE